MGQRLNNKVAIWTKVKDQLSRGDINYPCPSLDATKKELNRFWEELHYYLPAQLDDLIVALKGGESVNTNISSALKKLRVLFHKEFEWTFDDPEFIKKENQRAVVKKEKSSLRHSDDAQSEEEDVMSNAAKSFGSKSLAKEAPKTKAVVKATPKELPKVKPKPDALSKMDKASKTYSDSQSIKVLAKENPKRAGSEAHKRWGLYAKCKTVGAFLKAGGEQINLRDDVAKGYVQVK